MMATDKSQLAQLLRALADLIDSSRSADVEALLSGRMRLGIGIVSEGVAAVDPKRPRSTYLLDETEEVSQRLLALDSREEGIRFLESEQLTRRNLEALARRFELPVKKEDNLERLRDRIIDATIGARLNSLAIRGN